MKTFKKFAYMHVCMSALALKKIALLAAAVMAFSTAGWAQTYSGTGTFTKINSVEELTDGYYVIAYGTTYAMNNTHNGTYLARTAIAPSNDEIANPSVDIVWKISTNGGGKTIYNEASTKYVSYTGSSNNVQIVDAVTADNQRWTITYVSNLFVVTNKAETTRILQYNGTSGQERFCCYTSAQQKFTLYKMDTPPEPSDDPAVTVIPSSLAFGGVEVDSSKDLTFKLTPANLTDALTLSIKSGNSIFSVAPTTIGEAVDADTTITVTFTPAVAQVYLDTLVISGGGLAADKLVPLSGTGIVPSLTVLDSTQVRLVAMVNTNRSISIRVYAELMQGDVSLAISGTNADMFKIDSTTLVKPSNGTLTNKIVPLTYAPTAFGVHSATLTVSSAGMDNVVIPLSGTCNSAMLAAWTFDGLAGAPNTPTSIPATIGTATLYADSTNGSSKFVTASSNNEYTAQTGSALNDPRNPTSAGQALALLGGLSGTAANGKSIVLKLSTLGYKDLKLSFAIYSSSTGFRRHVWSYSTNGVDFTTTDSATYEIPTSFAIQTVDFSGVAALNNQAEVYVRLTVYGANGSSGNNRLDNIVFAAAPTPSLTATPGSLAFGTVEVDSTSAAQPLTVSGSNLTDTIAYVLGGDNPTAFAVSATSWTAADGGTLSVTFTPTAVGAYSATLTVSSTDATDKIVTLTGTGVAAGTPVLNTTPKSLNFGVLHSGTPSAARTVTVSAANLSPDTISYSLSNEDDFAVEAEVGYSSTNGGVLNVTFTPQGAGAKSGYLVVEAGTLTDTVALSGTGVVTSLECDSMQVRAGVVMEGLSKKITLKVNAEYLTDSVSLTLDGANADMFSIDSTAFAKPTSGALTDKQVNVTYAPTALGAHSATLTLSSAGVADVVVPLSGEGIPYVFTEDFENMTGSGGSYTGALVTFGTGQWWVKGYTTMDDQDHRNGARSVRLRGNSGDGDHTVEMRFDKPDGIGTVTFKFGSYGGHSGGQLKLQVSSDSGTTWQDRGQLITVPSWTAGGEVLQTATVTVNKVFPARIKIVNISNTGNKTVNVDDISITDCTATVPMLNISGSATFGYLKAGTTSEAQELTVSGENLSDTISYAVEGADSAAFTVSENTWTAADGGTLSVTFTPAEARSYTASFVVRSAGAEDVSVALIGAGLGFTPIPDIATGADTSPYSGQTVMIAGIVTGVLSNNKSCFIQSGSGAGSGIYVYRASTSSNLTVQAGDSVQLIGAVAEYYGLLELNVNNDDNIVKISGGHAIPAPEVITAGGFTKAHQGVLVTVNAAKVTAKVADTITISDASGSIRLAKDIYTFTLQVGDSVNVTGIGYRYGGNSRLLPRSSGDLAILSTSTPTSAAKELAEQVVVYPNPATSKLYISAPVEVAKVQIISSLGVVLQVVESQAEVNVSSLPSGIYYVRITFADGSSVVKKITK